MTSLKSYTSQRQLYQFFGAFLWRFDISLSRPRCLQALCAEGIFRSQKVERRSHFKKITLGEQDINLFQRFRRFCLKACFRRQALPRYHLGFIRLF